MKRSETHNESEELSERFSFIGWENDRALEHSFPGFLLSLH